MLGGQLGGVVEEREPDHGDGGRDGQRGHVMKDEANDAWD
jgi:hypothetical protein